MNGTPLLLGLALLTPSLCRAADIAVPLKAPVHRTVEYREVWRTDPYSDEYLMGNVTRAVTDEAGNTYFLDTQLQEVFKFDAAGNFIDTVAHEGEGPGEIQQTWQLAFWAPGQLILPRGFPAKIIRVAPDGTPLPELRVYRRPGDDSPASVSSLVAAGERAVVQGALFMFDDKGARSEQWIGVIDRDGNVLHDFGGKQTELSTDPLKRTHDEAQNFWEWDRWTVGPDGHLFRAPDREAWMIERFSLEGEVTARFTRDVPARARTAEEVDEIKEGWTFVFNGQKADIDFKLLDTVPPIGGLSFIDGRLWVTNSPAPDALPEGVWRRVSVLGTDGELIEERDLAVDHDPDLDRILQLSDGRIVVIENGVAANQAAMAAFGVEGDEDLEDAEPAVIVVYEAVQ